MITIKKSGAGLIHQEGGVRDPAKEMLLRNSLDVLRAFMECSDEIQHGILEMAKIMADPSADGDEKAAAGDTLMEALYPQYGDNDLGICSARCEDQQRGDEPEIEDDLDRQEATFAANLARLMSERNLTQQALAEKIGVGQPAVANMLARQCRPQRRTVEKVAAALGVDPKALWPFVD